MTAADRAPSAPRRIGPYDVLELIGEGAMAVVYLVSSPQLSRQKLALKLLKEGAEDREVLARFETEKETLALLRHPNIARILDAGSAADGRPFFVMEYVPGLSISRFADERGLCLRERLELFLQLCHGVAHAHGLGILHRDLKPSNVLVCDEDERPALKVIDFGVAKSIRQRLTERTSYTRLGRIVGTPVYMSPEQAGSTAEEMSPAADVYSLGVLLHELLVGEPPLDSESLGRASLDEVLRRVREDEAPPLSVRWQRLSRKRMDELAAVRQASPPDWAAMLRGDLDWIACKALEKEPRHRYGDAGELAADIERHLWDAPVSARPPGRAYLLRKFCRRHKGPVAAALVVFGALIVSTVAVLVSYAEVKATLRRVEQSEEAAEQAAASARLSESNARTALALYSRLADVRRLSELESRSEALWPALPSKVEAMSGWLEEARKLVGRLSRHREDLAALRASAEPYDEEQRRHDRESHPEAESLAWLRRRLRAIEEALAALQAAGHSASEVTVLKFGRPTARFITTYFRTRFRVIEPKRLEALKLRYTVDDGAAFYLNGIEIHRYNLPEGELRFTTLAAGEVGTASRHLPGSARVFDLRNPELVEGENVLAVELHQVGWRSDDLYLSLDLTGVTRAGEEVRLVDGDTRWRYDDRGFFPQPANWNADGFDASGWLEGAPPFGYGFSGGELVTEFQLGLEGAREEELRLEAAVSRRRTWRFSSPELQWRHDTLTALVDGLTGFQDPQAGRIVDVDARLAFASTVRARSLEDHASQWKAAVDSIADETECPLYGGLVVEPQLGLVPLGRDPRSGLWEFAELQTGTPPERGDDGELEITGESSLVFVLLPGGSFFMGAVPPDDDHPPGSPNVSLGANPDEAPVHSVSLAPFFLSKYEMTQGQWLRFTGHNPSHYDPTIIRRHRQVTLRHPVEQVSWNECRLVAERLGLVLPTEAQWEYACRGGTRTSWWTGDDRESLRGAENLADAGNERPNLDDGYSRHAPVGTYKANRYGLHDMAGNVDEWCRDRYWSYALTPAPGDGERRGEAPTKVERAVRGGNFNERARRLRSSERSFARPEVRHEYRGCRPARKVTRG